MESKKINIISETYPYGGGEQFFHLEVIELSKYFDEIEIYPLLDVEQKKSRALPTNVKVNFELQKMNHQPSFGKLLQNFRTILYFFFTELFRSKFNKTFLKRSKKRLFELTELTLKAKHLSFAKKGDFNYSFWMNDGALLLSILKYQKKIDHFVFRVNGYDIFDDRHEGNYMPYRWVNYKFTEKIFVLSQPALTYLEEKDVFKEKLELSHYGINDFGINKMDETDVFRIVSCSGMIQLKRIDKIISALQHIDFPVEWVHFGGGPLEEELKEKSKGLSQNVKVSIQGNVSHDQIISFYTNTSVNVFIHTSETEGLGMAIIEAQSFGIPALVTAVGGVVDIVSEETGILLDPSADGTAIANGINMIKNSTKFDQEYRTTIARLTLEKFSAKENYKVLAHKIIHN